MAITLQYRGPFEGTPSRTISPNLVPSGTTYIVNALGQVTVTDGDAPYLVAEGWAPVIPGSGLNYSVVDFGAFPGSAFASVAIPDAAPADTAALLLAQVMPVATADHSADEHLVDPPLVTAVPDGSGNVIISAVPGVGFRLPQPAQDAPDPMPYGKWSVGWAFLQ